MEIKKETKKEEIRKQENKQHRKRQREDFKGFLEIWREFSRIEGGRKGLGGGESHEKRDPYV